MSCYELKKGDRVDWKEYRNGEVLRVGRATIWAVFTARHGGGTFPVAAPIPEFRPHVVGVAVKIGEFIIRAPTSPGKVCIASSITGEAMETDEAKLESAIARFWNKEF